MAQVSNDGDFISTVILIFGVRVVGDAEHEEVGEKLAALDFLVGNVKSSRK
jgi:hypothetical protein